VIGKSVAERSYILVVSRFPHELAKRVAEALVAPFAPQKECQMTQRIAGL
jgi:hypothetical protein